VILLKFRVDFSESCDELFPGGDRNRDSETRCSMVSRLTTDYSRSGDGVAAYGKVEMMHLAMQNSEGKLFQSFLRCSSNYLEFGCGGSTCVAATLVSRSIISVDSSPDWLSKVSHECRGSGSLIQPDLVHIDIGPTGDWGYPTDSATRDLWPSYHSRVWQNTASTEADMYFVDGRFRVACFMQILLHARHNPIIAIHDFTARKSYQIIKEVAREIAIADDLSVFLRKKDQDGERVRSILETYSYEPE
jgi:hypothetical protein